MKNICKDMCDMIKEKDRLLGFIDLSLDMSANGKNGNRMLGRSCNLSIPVTLICSVSIIVGILVLLHACFFCIEGKIKKCCRKCDN